MGFPVGCTDLFLPKLLVSLLTILGFFRRFTHALLSILEPAAASYHHHEPRSVSAALIREFLPVVKFSDLAAAAESCAVCLYEFDGEDEIRRLVNCRHIFHRSCLDRWMDHDQKTCPLCRMQFVPEEKQAAFNEKLWLASGISDIYLPVSSGL
ncbi:Homeobox protein B-H1 [Salvia divinorum]|uniref:Homeobox protein B-H1 n=1 Tax=Salvia divinorum TaxID=28513 RepID=A0ABD1IK62_SALDI